jgi:acyl-CoA thioesterase-1
VEDKALSTILSDQSLMADFIHPNAAGYRKLADLVAEVLRKSGAGE